MIRYECPYISDGVTYSAVIWAASEAEAAEKMRALPWQPGNGPLHRAGSENRNSRLCVLLLLLAVGATATTAFTFKRADIELKQMASLMHLHHVARPPELSKISHRA